MHLRENLGQQSVPRHRVENARLRIHQYENHRGKADNRTDLDGLGKPRPLRAKAVDNDRNRIGHVQRGIRHQQSHDRCNEHINDSADNERTDDPERHVALGVFRLLSGGRNSFEADIGKEYDGRRAHDAIDTELPRPGIFGNEWRPVFRHQLRKVCKDNVSADENKRGKHADLDRDDNIVDLRRFRNADHQQERQRHTNQKGWKIEDRSDCGAIDQQRHAVFHHRMSSGSGKLRRYNKAKVGQQTDDITAPPDRDHRRREAIFEKEQRSHDPRHKLAERGVAIRIGRAGNWQRGGEFGVTKPGKSTDQSCHNERQHDRWSSMERRGASRTNENTSTNDAAHTKQKQVPLAQRTL